MFRLFRQILYCITSLNKAELLFYTETKSQLLNIIKYDLKAAAYMLE